MRLYNHLMQLNSDLQIEYVPVSRINLQDRFFSVSPPWWPTRTLLAESVARAGILTPLRVQEQGGRIRVVRGFQRADAAVRSGLQTLPCIRTAGPSKALFLSAVEDNLGTRTLHELELAVILQKLKRLHSTPDEELIDRCLPLLGLNPNRRRLELYLRAADLPEQSQQAVVKRILTLAVALKLGSWSQEDRELFLEIVSTLALGTNKQKQLYDLLETAAFRLGSSVGEAWERSLAGERLEQEHLSSGARFAQIRNALKRIASPLISEYEERYAQLRSALRLPRTVQMELPSHLEGTHLSVTIRAGGLDDLRDAVTRLAAATEGDEMSRIFDLLQGEL